MLIRNEHNQLQAISIPIGAFVMFTQGYRRTEPEVWSAQAAPSGFEHYSIMGVAPRTVPHGSSLWRVRADGSLMLVEDNHDSSD